MSKKEVADAVWTSLVERLNECVEMLMKINSFESLMSAEEDETYRRVDSGFQQIGSDFRAAKDEIARLSENLDSEQEQNELSDRAVAVVEHLSDRIKDLAGDLRILLQSHSADS
jgi:hypothetical protein